MSDKISRAVLTAAVTGTAVLLLAAPAAAHITAHSDDPVRGASDAVVSFRTPNEEDHAATVKLVVFLPRRHPLLDVLVEPRPGWHATTRVSSLPSPVSTDDGDITTAVSRVTWTADRPADGLQPGQADDFSLVVGQLPKDAAVTFRAIQTYSNGDVVKWIEAQAPGAEEPEHPAPVLSLQHADAARQAIGSTGTSAAGRGGSSDRVSRGLAIAALVLAAGSVGLGARALTRRT